MAEVKVLIEGWTNADSVAEGDEENDACTTTLIKDEEIIAVVDPGVLNDKSILIDALAKEGLRIKDITHVFVTHSHIDHYRNVGMFPVTTKVLEYWAEWNGGRPKNWDEQFTRNIRIIKTPGHNYDGLTFLVKTKLGQVAIVGDLWWKENYPSDDPYASDMQKLKESRKKILEIADYIIPGHGKMFKVEK